MAVPKEKKPNVLFDTLAALFNNKEYINGLTKESIKQNSFMINRRLAIMYPLQAQVFNNSKVNPVDVLHFWSDYLYNGKFPPRWIYTAGAAKSQAKKDDKKEITTAQIKAFCNRYGYSMKDINSALKFFPVEIIEEIKEFNKIAKQDESNQ